MLKPENQQEFDRIIHNACVMNPDYFQATTTTKVAKELLKQEMIFNHGDCYKFRAKSRGLGVYDMTITPL